MQLRCLSNHGQCLTYLCHTVIINCTFEARDLPYFEVNIANTSFSEPATLNFVKVRGKMELHDHGLFQIHSSTVNLPFAIVFFFFFKQPLADTKQKKKKKKCPEIST